MTSVNSNPSLTSNVAAFRRFNRAYTRLIGVLNEEWLEGGYSLAEARVLYEVATHQAITAKEIGVVLGMDPAYLTRILRRREQRSPAQRQHSQTDPRSALVH